MFSDLANDEIRHRKELERQFRAILRAEKWSPPAGAKKKDLRFKDPVIDPSLKKNVEETWFDSAALSIGVMLEKRAMDYYTEQENVALDPDVKAMFRWLAQWEKGHLDRLTALERAMREDIWNAAQFWPLD
jgi:rubrerythrin